jgi:hypothetical protein
VDVRLTQVYILQLTFGDKKMKTTIKLNDKFANLLSMIESSKVSIAATLEAAVNQAIEQRNSDVLANVAAQVRIDLANLSDTIEGDIKPNDAKVSKDYIKNAFTDLDSVISELIAESTDKVIDALEPSDNGASVEGETLDTNEGIEGIESADGDTVGFDGDDTGIVDSDIRTDNDIEPLSVEVFELSDSDKSNIDAVMGGLVEFDSIGNDYKSDTEQFMKHLKSVSHKATTLRYELHLLLIQAWLLAVKYRNTEYIGSVLAMARSNKGLVRVERLENYVKHYLGFEHSFSKETGKYQLKFAKKSKQPASYESKYSVAFTYNANHLATIKATPYYNVEQPKTEFKPKEDLNKIVSASARDAALYILTKDDSSNRQLDIDAIMAAFKANLLTQLADNKNKMKALDFKSRTGK